MALKFAKSYVTAPSSLDVSGGGSGIYIFAHRRVNSAGGKTAAIYNYSSVALPATVTPESYADLDELTRDEILISDDFGASWRVVPRTGTLTGALTVASYDDSWQLSTDYFEDTQLSIPFTLDFGDFSSAGSDDASFYIISEAGTATVDSLTFSVLDLTNNQVGRQYNGILEIALDGVLDMATGAINGSFNDSFIWQFPDISINRLDLTLSANTAAKVVLRLVNLPVGGLENNTLAFSLEIIPNQKLYPVSQGDPWYRGAIEINLREGFTPSFLASNGDGTFTLGKLRVNLGNTLAINASPVTITANASATYPKFLRVSPNGTFTITNQDQAGSLTLARIASVAGAITVQAPARSVNFASAVGGSALARRFVRVNASGNLALAADSAGIVGVSLSDTDTAYTFAGLAFIEAGAAVTAGSLVGSDSQGRAVMTATWRNAIALTAATAAGQVVLVNVQLTLSTGTGGSGGTGTVTSVGMTVPDYMSVTPASIDVSGTFNLTFNSQAANTVFAAPNGSTGVPGFRALASTDIPALDAGKITSGIIDPARLPGGSGLNSVGIDLEPEVEPILFVGNSPLTADGNIALGFVFQNSNLVFASPIGNIGAPTFRSLVSNDIPNLPAGKISSGIFSAAQIPELDASKISSGAFSAARMPVGTVVKTQTLRTTTNFITTLDTYQDTGISLAYTPVFSNSLLRVTVHTSASTNGATIFADVALFRDGNNMVNALPSTAHIRATSISNGTSVSIAFSDTVTLPSSAVTTFNLRLKRAAGVGTDNVAIGRRISAGGALDTLTMITVEEIRQ